MRTPDTPPAAGRPPPPAGGRAAAGSSLVALQAAPAPPPEPGTPPGLGSPPALGTPTGAARPAAHPDDAPTVIVPARPFTATDPTLGLAPGSKLGPYELIEAIGAGGMAAVLKARDTDLGRVVALKILPPHMARDAENVARFKHEARAAAKLDHDNVARVFACGEDRGLHYIAFEFVAGDTLKALIDRAGRLAPGECVRYMIQVAAGLAHATARGVVHRDIKPSNILITPDGRAKIVDMGLARSLGGQPANGGVTQSGVTLGTFDYISPEQALDPRRADVRSDIYSLGCTVYHALTGRPPVPEGTAARKLQAHQNDPVVDPRELNPAVPDELAAVLSRMMAKDPGRRYQTPADLIAALTALARRLDLGPDALPADPGLVPADPSAVHLLPQPPRVPVGLVAGLAAVAVAVVVLVGLSGPARPAVGGRGQDAARPWGDPQAVPKGVPLADLGPPGSAAPAPPAADPRPPAPAAGPRTAKDGAELIDLLRADGVTEVRLLPGRLYDLSGDARGVVVRGRKLALVGAAADPPVVRVAAVPFDPDDPAADRPGALTVADAEAVTFRGIRFEVADPPDPGEPAVRPPAVAAAEVGRVVVADCRFDPRPGLTITDAVGLAVVRRAGPRATVEVRNCYFGLRAGAAVQLTGRVSADVSESGFAPHPAAFALRADPAAGADPGRSDLRLRHCTFLLGGAAVEADDDARWDVAAGFCVFAGPPPDPAAMMADEPARRPAVLRAAGPTPAARFAGRPGQPNAYFAVDPFAAGGKGYSFADCRAMAPPPAADPAAEELPESPWADADPTAAAGPRPWAALRVKPTLRGVRVPKPNYVLGVRFLPAARAELYDPWPPAAVPDAVPLAGPGVKVWWPAAPDKGPPPAANEFRSLAAAVAALQPGDELHVRHRGAGELPVPEAVFARPGLRATVRPEPGSDPVLTLADGDAERPALFRVADGAELVLDGLRVRLGRPAGRKDVKSAAVVAVAGGRRCDLKNCVVTLDPRDGEPLAAVYLADPAGGPRPDVRLDNCLVRGRGQAVWVASARPLDLAVANTVTALAGAVVRVDAPAGPPAAGAARVRLDRVTAGLAGPLLDLRPGRPADGGRPAGWVPVEVAADRCLFAFVNNKAMLAAVDGGDPAALDGTFTWAGRGDGYANWPAGATYLEVTPADAMAARKAFDADGWFAAGREPAGAAVGVTFAAPSAVLRDLPAATAAHFEVKVVDPPGAAADAGAQTNRVAKPAAGGDR